MCRSIISYLATTMKLYPTARNFQKYSFAMKSIRASSNNSWNPQTVEHRPIITLIGLISPKISTTRNDPYLPREFNAKFIERVKYEIDLLHNKINHYRAVLLTKICFVTYIDKFLEKVNFKILDIFGRLYKVLSVGMIAENLDKHTASKACLAAEARCWFLYFLSNPAQKKDTFPESSFLTHIFN